MFVAYQYRTVVTTVIIIYFCPAAVPQHLPFLCASPAHPHTQHPPLTFCQSTESGRRRLLYSGSAPKSVDHIQHALTRAPTNQRAEGAVPSRWSGRKRPISARAPPDKAIASTVVGRWSGALFMCARRVLKEPRWAEAAQRGHKSWLAMERCVRGLQRKGDDKHRTVHGEQQAPEK